MLSPEVPYKVVAFSYIPLATDPNSVICIYHRSHDGGNGSRSWPINDYHSLKHNIFNFHGYGKDENDPLFSCSISSDTLTLTAIRDDWKHFDTERDWDIEAGEVFFTGKKVEKFDWEK